MNSEIKDKGHFQRCIKSIHDVREILVKKVDGRRRELDNLMNIQVPDPKILALQLKQLEDKLRDEDFKQSDQYETWDEYKLMLHKKLSQMDIKYCSVFKQKLEQKVNSLEQNKDYQKQENRFNDFCNDLEDSHTYLVELYQYKFLINYERQLNQIKQIANNFESGQRKTIMPYIETSMALNNNYEFKGQLEDFIKYINILSTMEDKKNWKVVLMNQKSQDQPSYNKSDYEKYSVLIIIFKASEENEYYFAQIENTGEVSVNILKLSQYKLYCQSKNRVEAKQKLEQLGFSNPSNNNKLLKQPLNQETLIEQICTILQLDPKRLTQEALKKVSYFEQLLGLSHCDQFLLETLVKEEKKR